jgi:hypothetical protein
MEILQYLHSTQCLVVNVGAEDIGEQSRSFRIEMLPTPSTIMLGGARPSLSDPALLMTVCRSRLLTAPNANHVSWCPRV